MTSRPYSQTGFPSKAVYTTFGSNLTTDSNLVDSWNTALHFAYMDTAKKYRFVELLDTENMVAGNYQSAVVSADKNPFALNLVHPNNAGYKAIADGLVMLMQGKTSGYSPARALQAEGLVTYFGQTAIEYYNLYPDGNNFYTKRFEQDGTVAATYIEINIPLSAFNAVRGADVTFSYRLENKSSGAFTFLSSNVTDPDGLGIKTRIGGLSMAVAKQGAGKLSLFSDKRIPKPARSAFGATMQAARTNTTGDATMYPVVFGGVSFDGNGDFNSATNVFTAPVTGIYQFSGTVFLNNIGAGHTQCEAFLQVNASYVQLFDINAAIVKNTTGGIILSYGTMQTLTAGATVALIVRGSNSTKTIGVAGGTTFCGHLIT